MAHEIGIQGNGAENMFGPISNSNKNANEKIQDDSFIASLINSKANENVYVTSTSRSNDREVPIKEATPQPAIQDQEQDTSFSSTSSSSSATLPALLLSCKCAKTRCLQLYCECFHKGQVCSNQCACVDCGNTSHNTTERLQKMTSVLKRNRNAFDEDNSFSKKSRRAKNGCSCSSSHCLKKYCSCFWNQVECTKEKCGCAQCENPYGKKITGTKEKSEGDSALAPQELPPDIQQTLSRLSKKPRQSSAARTAIEHYPSITTDHTAHALKLQKEANLNSATSNLLSLKQMLLQSRHKLADLEYAMGELEDSNASKVRVDRQMMAIREAIDSIKVLERQVKKMEESIAEKYDCVLFL